MPRSARKESSADLYHVTMRGVGRQIIFEDDDDRRIFLGLLRSATQLYGADVLAWCLMDNHVHLVVRCPVAELSKAMGRVGSQYASRFNARHDRVGHLFQDRFGSVPIETDEQLLATVRYVHLNPLKSYGIPVGEYRWSSYRWYLGDSRPPAYGLVLELAGGIDGFVALHEREEAKGSLANASATAPHERIGNDEALAIARNVLGETALADVKGLPKARRNEVLRSLREAGLTIKQIERLTSIGRNIIARAK